MLRDKEKRQFFRHPIHAPLRLATERSPHTPEPTSLTTECEDLSLGGLSFVWHEHLRKGERVRIWIGVKEKVFEVAGKVAYSVGTSRSGQYRSGIAFQDAPSAFRAKLAEEAIEILHYRKTLSKALGQEISEEEAAQRWVQEFAERFPSFGAP